MIEQHTAKDATIFFRIKYTSTSLIKTENILTSKYRHLNKLNKGFRELSIHKI